MDSMDSEWISKSYVAKFSVESRLYFAESGAKVLSHCLWSLKKS